MGSTKIVIRGRFLPKGREMIFTLFYVLSNLAENVKCDQKTLLNLKQGLSMRAFSLGAETYNL